MRLAPPQPRNIGEADRRNKGLGTELKQTTKTDQDENAE